MPHRDTQRHLPRVRHASTTHRQTGASLPSAAFEIHVSSRRQIFCTSTWALGYSEGTHSSTLGATAAVYEQGCHICYPLFACFVLFLIFHLWTGFAMKFKFFLSQPPTCLEGGWVQPCLAWFYFILFLVLTNRSWKHVIFSFTFNFLSWIDGERYFLRCVNHSLTALALLRDIVSGEFA